ncbi:MAG: Na(+)-translocating NADH-quinone reductase subunit A [Bacteroidales bacterium]|nr:Na(+)-translocating NADH-quinone reductase subunit A [Bacteroidales bacterium]
MKNIENKDVYKIKKGLDIRIVGKAEKRFLGSYVNSPYVGIYPDDLVDFTPKMLLKEGDSVKIGSPIFFDKDRPLIKICSPVSGKIKEIRRGAKRKIETIVIENDFQNTHSEVRELKSEERETIINFLLETGLFAFIKQRPYNIIADYDKRPKAIFISAFDSAPLAPDVNYILEGTELYIQAAIDLLKKLTDVKIYVGLKFGEDSIFKKIKNIEIKYFEGPHPAGNVGIQIHHVDPINKGEIIWTIRPEDLVVIGKYLIDKKFDLRRKIALTGSQLTKKGYIETILGAQLSSIIELGDLVSDNNRFISGNVLTGRNVGYNGFLGFYDRMITVIPEGNYYEFFGWLKPGLKKYSPSKMFFSWLCKKKEYILDTNYHGSPRPFVVTGEYEKVLPMDIYPQQLLKAAITKNIPLMENLGIYEVVEEDLALCEYVCTSKIEVQQIIREALNMLRKENS